MIKKNNHIRDLDNEEIEENKYYKSLFKKISNELDKLIHDSYKIYGSSGYYKMFCDKNIIIGKTYIK